LLKVFSRVLDEDAAAGKTPPQRILDAGCGVGVIGICAAGAISAVAPQVYIRAQDRDELARLVTLHNAAKNGIPASALEAHTEPLLAGPGRWDYILSNIPAKAGMPVLEDFVRRSAGLLNPDGKVILVVVHTLADLFREQITASAELVLEQKGSGHNVFVYTGTKNKEQRTEDKGAVFLERYSFYARAVATSVIEKIPVSIETIHGAGGFDEPGGAVLAMAKLITRIGLEKLAIDNGPLLVHEPDQGFFPCFLLQYFTTNQHEPSLILSGRNILGLEAARHNTGAAAIVPVADLQLGKTALLEAAGGQPYALIAAFPELLPQSSLPKEVDQLAALWDALPPLLVTNGIFLVAFGSSDAERFDRRKPPGFTRLGSIKRDGFRALAYRYC